MADKRISQLVERVTLATNDVFPIVASGATTTNKVTLQTIDDYMQTNLEFGVTSVAISVPTGLSVTGTPITSTGTFVITFTAGYSIPTTAKQTQWDTAYTNRITSATAPLGIASNVISITQSGASTDGYLSSTDWNTFNNKQSTITTGNLTEATSSVLTITGGTGAVLGSGTSIQVKQASGSQDGFLDSADWTTFNDKQNALSGTGIVKSTGGTISYLTDNTSNWDSAFNDKINSASVTGTTTKTLTLTQQDGGTITTTWTDLDTGTVTSVGVSMPSAFSVSNSPITSSGTIAITGAGTISQYIDGTGALQTFPSGLPPTGAAGGDLTGTYPNPTVHRVHGIDLQNGTPTADDVWVYGGSPAKWQHQKLHSNQVTEDGNLFYTDARARASISESVIGLDYNSTTGVLSTTTGYSIPTNASQTNWTAAYDDTILSAAVSGTTTKTLTLTQRDSNTITASWTDINTDAVSSVFGRTGAVIAVSGDYNTDQVTEGTSSLYFTNARARSSITLTTAGTSGSSVYNSTTGALNIPSYTLAGLGGQPALNGTGFVKATGTTITYDNSTYLTTGSAASTYLPLAGGTLTGQLLGTSARFDSFVGVNKAGANDVGSGPYVVVSQTTSSIQYLMQLNASAGLDWWHYNGTEWKTPMKILTAGTTIFSGAYGADAGVKLFGTTYGVYAASRGTAAYSAGMNYISVNSQKWFAGIYENSDNFGFYSTSLNSLPFILNYTTGAATFSSSVTATNMNVFGTTELAYVNGTTQMRISRSGTTARIQNYEDGAVANLALNWEGGNVAIGTTNGVTRLSLGSYSGARLPYIDGTGATWNGGGITVTSSNTGNATIGGGLDLTNNVYSVGSYSPIISFSSLSSNGAYNNSYAAIWGILGGSGGDANWLQGDLAFGCAVSYGIDERMRLKNDGRLFIGTKTGVSGGGLLQVNGDVNINGNFKINGTTIGGGGGSGVTGSGTSGRLTKWTGSTTLGNSLLDDNGSRIRMFNGDGIQISTGASTTVGGGSFIALTNAAADRWQLQQINPTNGLDWWTLPDGTNWSVKMTLTGGGNLGLGTLTPTPHNGSSALVIKGGGGGRGIMEIWDGTSGKAVFQQVGGTTYIGNLDKAVTGGDVIMLVNGTGPSADISTTFKANGNVLVGNIADNGNKLQVLGGIYASGDVIAFSDISVKKNIRNIENALERVVKSRGVIYDRKDIDSINNIGFIAQELEQQFPELISNNPDGTKGVKYQNAVAVLFEAIKEQQKQIDGLKKQVA